MKTIHSTTDPIARQSIKLHLNFKDVYEKKYLKISSKSHYISLEIHENNFLGILLKFLDDTLWSSKGHNIFEFVNEI